MSEIPRWDDIFGAIAIGGFVLVLFIPLAGLLGPIIVGDLLADRRERLGRKRTWRGFILSGLAGGIWCIGYYFGLILLID